MLQENAQQGHTLMETGWTALYRLAGIGTLITVAFVLLDIALTFAGGDVPTGQLSAVDWFAHLNSRPLVGLRNLGLFNVINPLLTLPLYLALYQLHRRIRPVSAALALILLLVGYGIYAANNRALSMLALSQHYAGATSEAQRSLLAAAGTVILAQAEDFTPGTFLGLFLQSIASLLMLVVMLQGKRFNRWIALLGVVGAALLLFFTISVTFVPSIFNLAMLFAMAGGLMMLAWDILVALHMLRLAKISPSAGQRVCAAVPFQPGQKEMSAQ